MSASSSGIVIFSMIGFIFFLLLLERPGVLQAQLGLEVQIKDVYNNCDLKSSPFVRQLLPKVGLNYILLSIFGFRL